LTSDKKRAEQFTFPYERFAELFGTRICSEPQTFPLSEKEEDSVVHCDDLDKTSRGQSILSEMAAFQTAMKGSRNLRPSETFWILCIARCQCNTPRWPISIVHLSYRPMFVSLFKLVPVPLNYGPKHRMGNLKSETDAIILQVAKENSKRPGPEAMSPGDWRKPKL
jgi:hypothetical protein